MSPRVVVVGPPGSGKTTVGALLADHYGVAFKDSDDDITERAGKSIADIFTDDGESAFRRLEQDSIMAALDTHDGVLAVGGGAVLSATTRGRLAEHRVVFLNLGLAAGVRRTGVSAARPLLAGVNPRATYRALLEERLSMYREVSATEIDTDERSPGEVVQMIVEQLGQPIGPHSRPE